MLADYEVHLRLWALITDRASAKKCNLVFINNVFFSINYSLMAEINAINVDLLILCDLNLLVVSF